MYAVFKLSGFQYQAEEGALVKVPFQDAEKGTKFDINEVMLIKGDKDTLTGRPFVADAKIEAEVVDNGKDDKIKVRVYKRRTKYRRMQGHRQDFTEIRINKIVVPEA